MIRRHDIAPFDGGRTPPSWPLVPAELDAWVPRANGVQCGDEPLAEVRDAHGGAPVPDGSRRGLVSGSFFHAIARE